MKEDANAQYLTVLNALAAHIEKNKSELVFANYEIERLKKKLEEAEQKLNK